MLIFHSTLWNVRYLSLIEPALLANHLASSLVVVDHAITHLSAAADADLPGSPER